MNTNDGGPAFPVECDWSTGELRGQQTTNAGGWHVGMTLRDYFAAKAFGGTLANSAFHDDSPESLARWAYEMADAMLKAREVKS